MKDTAQSIVLVILFIIIALIWLFPIGICIYTGDWWLMFLYIVWVIPGSILTLLVSLLIKFMIENYY